MKNASITYAKNNLSRLIEAVREGNTIWITDRDVPVARLTPVNEGELPPAGRVAELVRAGLVRPPRHALDLQRFNKRPRARTKHRVSAAQAAIDERSESP